MDDVQQKRRGGAKAAGVIFPALAVAAVSALAPPAAPPVGASSCSETRLGAGMMLKAAREGQPPALVAASRLRAEIIAALAAGMTVHEVAFCLDISPETLDGLVLSRFRLSPSLDL